MVQFLKAVLGLRSEQNNWKWFKRLFKLENRLENLWITSSVKIFPVKNKNTRLGVHYFNYLLTKRKLKNLDLKNPVLWIYTPDAVDYTRWLDNSLIIYDCVDEYSAQPWYQENFNGIIENELELLSKASLVFTSAEGLFEKKRKYNRRTFLLENVAEFEHFNQVKVNDLTVPKELLKINNGPIVGFIGAIDQYKLDIEAILKLSDENPEWNIVLIGPHGEAEKASPIDKLKRKKNVHLLGAKRYEDLPLYISGFDVCIIPYVKNDYTKGCFPLKFFEYLASGKPVVTLGLPALEKYSDYNVYTSDFSEFVQKIKYYLNNNDTSDEIERRIQLAKANTWGSKVTKMEEIIRVYQLEQKDLEVNKFNIKEERGVLN